MVAPLLIPILTSLAPTIAKALTGPLLGVATGWLAKKLGIPDASLDAINNALNNMSPADQLRLKEMELEFQKFMADNGIKLDLAQIEVNKQEAQSDSIFVAGWRPFIGWVCGSALAYAAILEPLARFIVLRWNPAASFPVIDTNLTMQVMLGMLGMAGLRSWEKKENVSREKI